MPETGTEGHATLLLAEYLAQRTNRALALEELHEYVRQQAAEHRSYWRRNAGEPGAEVELTARALDRLEALRLVHRTPRSGPGGLQVCHVTALPALARYALTTPTVRNMT
jgi:uncharacterized protein (TIGR02678 family)